jgi:hypothetical protein
MSNNPFYQDGLGAFGGSYRGSNGKKGGIQNGQLPMEHPPPPYQMPSVQGYAQPGQHWGPPQGQHQQPPHLHPHPHPSLPAAAGGYRPQIGFVKLPPRFYMWSKVKWSGGLSLEMRAEPSSPPLYLAKQTNSGVTFLEASDTSRLIGKASDKSLFSSKTILDFHGFQSELSKYSDEANYFTAPVNGRLESFEWRNSAHGGSMVLLPRGAPSHAPPIASWSARKGGVSNDKEAGVFEFHEPATSGEMGDVLVTLAVMAMARIVHTQYANGLAAAGSVAGSSAVAAASG